MASIAVENSLFEIDMELDGLLEEMEYQVETEGQASEDLVARFQSFCDAHGEKVDRIGRFVRMMEAREQFCRSEAVRLSDRARAAAGKVERTKNMVLYYLLSRDLKKIEGRNSHCALREIAKIRSGSLTKPRFRSPSVGSKRGLPALFGRLFSHFSRKNSSR